MDAIMNTPASRPTLCIGILTLNEEKRIAQCIRSAHFADQILVIDSGSQDQTQALALQAGARARAREAGLAEADIVTFRVPGAYEIAQAAQRVAETGDWQAVVCLGCLIRGETAHFEYVAGASAIGIREAAQETGVRMPNQ